MKLFILCLIIMGVMACSKKQVAAEQEENGIELADAVEFTDEESEDIIGDLTEDDALDTTDPNLTSEAVPDAMPVNDGTTLVTAGSEERTYSVGKNETLMLIAFKIYGDYKMWRKLAQKNQDLLNGSQNVTEGMALKYDAPTQEFVFSPSGNPYLIRRGDTLGKISDTTYGTVKHWKDIWDNNRPLIKDPNVIFAGFTIFTPILEGRDVAFENI